MEVGEEVEVEEEVVAVAATFESAAMTSVVKVLLGCGTTVTLRVVVAAVRDDVVVGGVLVLLSFSAVDIC